MRSVFREPATRSIATANLKRVVFRTSLSAELLRK